MAYSCEDGSYIDARAMGGDDVYLFHYTQRDDFVNPNQVLKVEVYADGNVFYKKPPSRIFSKKEYGKGKVLIQ